jgi:Holliday junction resolvase RusA-like endonuclease
MLRVWIPGQPKPQGSKIAGLRKDGTIFMREANSNARPWRNVVIEALSKEAPDTLEGAVRVHLHFYMPMLKNPIPYPITRSSYDIDKLSRSILDALTIAKIIKDDSQVVTLIATKEYSEQPGVQIKVELFEDFLERFWE